MFAIKQVNGSGFFFLFSSSASRCNTQGTTLEAKTTFFPEGLQVPPSLTFHPPELSEINNCSLPSGFKCFVIAAPTKIVILSVSFSEEI